MHSSYLSVATSADASPDRKDVALAISVLSHQTGKYDYVECAGIA
jgi:hypothetical protein